MEYKEAKTYAYRRLAIKSQPTTELDKALKEKGASSDIRAKIIEELLHLGYLNDEEWIQNFIRAQILKKTGPKAIFQKLKAKGLPEELFASQLENCDQSEQIQGLLATRYKTRDLSDFKQKQKVIAALIRKGFDYDEIRQVMG